MVVPSRRVTALCTAAIMGLGLMAAGASPAIARVSGSQPFVAIHYIHVPLRAGLEPYGPTWTQDGRHILFTNEVDGRTWIVGSNGRGLHCITCGFSDDPGPSMTGGLFFVYSFPDEKRLFLGSGVASLSAPGRTVADVIECRPSIFDCRSHQVLPVDLSADANPAEPIFQRRTWHLSPDGKHLLWMEVRPDGSVMVLAKLVRASSTYVAVDPRDINPPGPTGPTDSKPTDWEYTGQTFEGKSFADGGREVEYLGGPSMDNFDVETVNLATGARKRLTSAPDWDEDGAISPNNRLLVTASWRSMRRIDVLGGMLPEVHSYIDFPFMTAIVANYVSSHQGFQCDLTPWLLPASGDSGGAVLGQPLGTYRGGDSYVANNLVGQPMWNPNGTEVLLQERLYGPSQGTGYIEPTLGSVPSRLLIAKLATRGSRPVPVGSSDVGSWAPSVTKAGTGYDHPTTVTVRGRASGTATITYTGNIVSSRDSVTYHHFSDDGKSFADGTETIDNPFLTTRPITLSADITISGAQHGFWHANLSVGEGPGQAPTGTVESELDGSYRSGLPAAGACPTSMPHPSRVKTTVRVSRGGPVARVTVRATASLRGAGMNELGGYTRPIEGAVVTLAGARATSNGHGIATLEVRRTGRAHTYRLRVNAGDTFIPRAAKVVIPGGGS